MKSTTPCGAQRVRLYNLNDVYFTLINFLSIGATFRESCSSPSWLAKHDITVSAQDNSLCMTENCCDLETTRALDIHEERIWSLHESLKLVSSRFNFWRGIQQISWHFLNKYYGKLQKNLHKHV